MKIKNKKKSLHQQAYDKLKSMLTLKRSKNKDKHNEGIQKNIYQDTTFNTYFKHIKYFINYVKKNHPECTKLKDARKYVKEWLEYQTSKGYSAWTINLEAKALGKLYQISP